jgi:hypothetical protein
MAKDKKSWFGGKDDDKAKDEPAQTPSNTTSGGDDVTPTDGPAKVEGAEGIAVYPPSPGDQAGEKTDNVPPSKRLPPDVPPEEGGADELTLLRAQNAALAGVVRNLGGNPEEVSKTATAGLTADRKAKVGPTRKAFVTPPGGSEMEVEFPADAPNPETAAVDAYKAKAGVWSMPTAPAVRFDDADKPAPRKGRKAADKDDSDEGK